MSSLPPASDPLPDPYRKGEEPTIGPAPVPVMEQVFWVQLKLPPEHSVAVFPPPGIKLLDRTKPGRDRQWTRFYFRADRGFPAAPIAFQPAGKPRIAVPVKVLTYREDVEDKTRGMTELDPVARKRGRSYHTAELIAVAKENLAAFPALREELDIPTRFDRMSDPELFAALPSWNIPRQCYSAWSCPFCGKDLSSVSTFYPWINQDAGTFQCRCPLCGKHGPTNRLADDDFTSGSFPDDGWGWDPGSGKREEFHGWAAYHAHHAIWQTLGVALRILSRRYLLLGDQAAAHHAGMLLARLAYVYPGLDMSWQQVDSRYLQSGRLLQDGNWERRDILVPAAQAYDAIYDYLETDECLAAFLQTKDSVIRFPSDVKSLIETYFIQLIGWDWMARRLSGGNMGMREADLAHFAVCADMGAVSERWLEELFTHAYNSGLDKGGCDDETFINTLTREGLTWIGAFGYSLHYLAAQSRLAEILSRISAPKWRSRCAVYASTRYPRFRAAFDTWIDILVAGQFAPNYGDSFTPLGKKFPQGVAAESHAAFCRAFRRWPTDKLAHALYKAGRRPPELFEKDIWPEVAAQVARIGPESPQASRVMDDLGFVLLESRSGASDCNQCAGLALRYGYGWGHAHHDNLNLELFAHGLDMTPDLGYYGWPHPMGNTDHVAHHITGMIDRRSQYEGASSSAKGTLELFAAAPEASFADVSAAPGGFPNRMYRRAVCLADAPGGRVYLLDILRLAGGAIRTHCFHGPPHDAFQASLSFGPKESGSYAINNIIEPQSATHTGPMWADWKYQQQNVRLRLTHLGGMGRRYLTAVCAKPDSPPIRYLFAEEESPDGATEFVSVWEPYLDSPCIEKVERLPLEPEGQEPSGFRPLAIRVSLKGGQVDTFFYSHDPDTLRRCGEIEFKGSFGYWSERNGTLRCLHLVNGERLRRGSEGVGDIAPAFRAMVVRADLAQNLFTLDRELPDTLSRGAVVWLRGGKHRTAYHLAEAPAASNRLQLDLNGCIFRSVVTRVSEDGTYLVCEVPPPIEAVRWIKSGYYEDAVVTGADLQARYRVRKVEAEKVWLDRPIVLDDFPDTAGDGRRIVQFYDHAEGDAVTIPRSVFRMLA